MVEDRGTGQLEALIAVVKSGDAARVRQLVSSDNRLANARLPNGESPVMAAIYRGHHEIVAALIDAGAVIDVFTAAALGRTDDLRQRLTPPAHVNDVAYDGWTPLHLAAFFGQLEAVRLLLDSGADVRAVARNTLANTPLHAATAGKHAEVALLLHAHGADPLAVDSGGYTPLKIARQNGLTGVVSVFDSRDSKLDPR